MAMVVLYAPDETDFSTLGLGALTPSECTVTWQAAGAYELTLAQPIDETLRWAQLQNGCIISAPVPVRESPLYEYSVGDGGSGSVTRNIWQVMRTSVGLNMRTGYGTGHKIIRHYKNGTQVIELDRQMVGGRLWIHCTTVEGGETGYMSTKYLELVETKTETISGGRPENQRVIQLTQSRMQLFRVYSTEQDSDAGVVTVKARHVFYDLAGNMLNEEYSPENISGAAAAQEVFAHLKNAHDFSLYTEGLTQGSVTGEYAYKNPVEILLDPDEGIVSQCGCQIIRDNFDVHLIDDIESDMGVTVRRGKNLAGVTATTDESDVVTQIKPCGKDADGNEFWLADAEGDGRYVNSAHINEYAVVRTVKKDYDVSLVKKDEDNETTFRDNASGRSAARAKLRELAEQDFADGADLPSYGLEVDFVLLQDAEGYEQYAGLQAVHPYDTVTVIDSLIGLTARLRVMGYEWDALTGQYADVTLGDLSSLEQTVYSYNLPDGGISGTKIAPGTASGSILRDATIQYAKISVAAIEQLSAEAIVALTARINEIVAGKLTTDELYAAYAELIALKAGTITAENIETDALAAELARITVLAAGSASFDRATVAHLVAEAMNLQFGTAGQVFIQNLAVEYAQMVGAAIGNLCIKASDGSYYSLDVSADGSVTATPTTVTEGEISAGETGSGRVILETNITASNLNTSNLLATYALVNKIDAARIDVAELFAQRAFIDLLTTSNIFGGKSLTMIAGQVEQNATDIASNNIHTGAEPPEAPVPDGKLWVDTAQDPNVIRRWLGQNVSTERDYTASASGNPVETPPGTASFDGLQSVLLPVQAGSGDPSPDNIRPISGRTVATLTRCGKNLMDLSQGYGYDELKPLNAPVGTPITFSLFPTDGASQFNGRIIYEDDTTHDFAIIGRNADNNIWHTYTITPEKHIKEYSIYDTDGSSKRTISKGMIEYGSTATTFEPYQGDTHTADFGQTVYGGTLDWLTGVLTVEWGLISSYAGEALSGEWMSDRDVYSTGATPTTGAQIAYKLATPITIQLPPATVTALKGVNTLYTDGDSVSVAYTASGWEIVNDLSEINDVSNRLLAQQAAAQQAIDQLATAITVDSDGAHFYKPGYRAQNEVRIDQDSVDILVGGSVNSSFVAGGLILGNYMLWHPEAAGGLAFNLI